MDNLELNPRIVLAVKRANLAASWTAVLNLSCGDLQRRTKLSANDIRQLQQAVSRQVYKNPSATALGMLEGNCDASLVTGALSTGCRVLDAFLRGGILSRGITEVAGESAAGKTQVCMQLCLSVQRTSANGGLDGGAVYICTEDVFPSKRLQQLIESFGAKLDPAEAAHLRLGDNIFIEHVSERDQLVHCIQHRIPFLLRQSRVKLVVLDSVAALFRCEFNAGEAARRAKHLQTLAAQLHGLSRVYGVPVVCVNQVTANMSDDGAAPSRRHLIPALGLAWSNLVQTRLVLGRTPYRLSSGRAEGEEGEDGGLQPRPVSGRGEAAAEAGPEAAGVPVRSMEVAFAPHLPNDTCYFVVEASGVRGLR